MEQVSNTQRSTSSAQRSMEDRLPALGAKAWFWTIVELAVGGIFIYAGVLKALDPLQFAQDIYNFRILPWPVGVRLAFYLPWLEILCGGALIVRQLRQGALGILTLLMFIFITATLVAKARGIDVVCGCFGAASKGLSFTWHMVLDFTLLGAVAACWWRAGRVR